MANSSRFKWTFLALTLLSVLAATGLTYWLKPSASDDKQIENPQKGIPARLFHDWSKPDFVLVLTAQQHGYLFPCGCSRPQVGGLERRYNFMQLLKQRGWPIVAVDLGDVAQKEGPAHLPNVQGLLKYQYSMKALQRMSYLGVGVGEYEATYPLTRIEDEWAAKFDTPAVLAGNLEKSAHHFRSFKAMAAQSVPGVNVKVGVVNIIGPTVQERIQNLDPAVRFEPIAPTLDAVWENMRTEKVDLPILLYHGFASGVKDAIRLAEKDPRFPVLICLSAEDERPARPIVGNRRNGPPGFVIRLGLQGKNIGVLGVYRSGQDASPFAFKYQLVEMSEDYLTPKEQEADHPIMKLMEEYSRELKDKEFLARYDGLGKHHLQKMPAVAGLRNPGNGKPSYIGSKSCGKCHESAYEVWQNSAHSHAYQTLVDARHPSLRQYDGECIVCHVVGFSHNTGFTNAERTPKLKDVGCESCHGPGSLHAKNPKNEEWQMRMNQAWRGAKSIEAKNLAIDHFCQTCHDHDNDVTWLPTGLTEKWAKIAHGKDG